MAPGADGTRYNRWLILCHSSTLTPSIFVSATDAEYLQNWMQKMHYRRLYQVHTDTG